jgi:4-hydroxy-tetrahydrodipicolinate reductase
VTPVLIFGSAGRMGQALQQAAKDLPAVKIVAAVGRKDNLADSIGKAEVVIDFSSPQTTAEVLRLCQKNKTALVLGTTGHDSKARRSIHQASARIPIVFAANFSTGVTTLFWLTEKTAEILGPDFDLEVVEMHHRNKKDAPSGTAHELARILAQARKKQLEKVLRHGREGLVGARTRDEIGMHSMRGGDVVGDHTVVFAGLGERLELTHKASNRETFARGALQAARWVAGRKAGLYNMGDVLGLTRLSRA